MLLVTVSVLRVCLPVKATYFSYVVVVVVAAAAAFILLECFPDRNYNLLPPLFQAAVCLAAEVIGRPDDAVRRPD